MNSMYVTGYVKSALTIFMNKYVMSTVQSKDLHIIDIEYNDGRIQVTLGNGQKYNVTITEVK
jgi:hypothetical protein